MSQLNICICSTVYIFLVEQKHNLVTQQVLSHNVLVVNILHRNRKYIHTGRLLNGDNIVAIC